VSRISQLLGHELELVSKEGEGSEFIVHVPRGENTKVKQAGTTALPEFDQDLQGLRVLVIDDETAILDALKVLLEGWGCNVVTSETVESATQQLQERGIEPDAILSDYRLRENTNGIEAIKAVETLVGREIPSLLITGDMNIEPQAAGIEEYRVLHKPVQPARLRAFLKHVEGQKNLKTDEA
jgi:DNA-binding NtrC family response regulator